jgi:hypothetical protein
MNPIHFEIQREIGALDQVITARSLLTKKGVHGKETHEKDLLICIQSRSLFSRFIDTALWAGVDSATIEGVRAALSRALQCLREAKGKADERCMASVEERIKGFNKFVTEDLPKMTPAASNEQEIAAR